jgi:5-formaminoimidazole-4-carboxamide-1-(beta)-D-ribofuranosyl 5'-monophosphate synthetase
MIDRKAIHEVLEDYDPSNAMIGVIGSHSALDTCDGAVEEGFHTLAVCQEGRDAPYSRYFKAFRDKKDNVTRGMVDEIMMLPKFKDILKPDIMSDLRSRSVLFVPNRSFTSYCSIDSVENDFLVPLVGSRNLLRSEDRGGPRDYYWLLDQAGMPYPRKITDPQDIDSLSIVKLHHAKKKLERGFFTCATYDEYVQKSEQLIKQRVIDRETLESARMEEYIIGPVFNLDFFYSPLEKRGKQVELIGVDWRFESSLDGHVRIPAAQQITLNEDQRVPEYTVCGHNSATLRESLLEKAFELAEKYVQATKELFSPGIIGPFCLQTCVDKDLNFFIYDVAPRIGGGTNVHMNVGHAYGNSLWRKNMSTGRRLAMEVRRAVEEGRLKEIVT